MKELSLEEYKREHDNFVQKYSEYMQKLVAINSKETEANEEECELERKLLKQQYGIYTSIYNTDFCTELTEESARELNPKNLTVFSLLERVNQYKGKQLQDGEGTIYTMEKIVIAPDDLYYQFKGDNDHILYQSCIKCPDLLD